MEELSLISAKLRHVKDEKMYHYWKEIKRGKISLSTTGSKVALYVVVAQ